MKDSAQTLVSDSMSDSSAAAAGNRKKMWIAGGVGCLLLACVGLLIGGGVFFVRGPGESLLAGVGTGSNETPTLTAPVESSIEAPEASAEASTAEPSPATTPTEELSTTEPPAEATSENIEEQSASDEPAARDESDVLPADAEPEISRITFALGATPDDDEYDPIEPGVSFEEGITEIHAIFDYDGMSDNYTWERVWYLDGDEILRNSTEWADDTKGRFDYFLDAGGEPLPPGEWLLELYVEDELLATGDFTIEASESPEIAAVDDNDAEQPLVASATPTSDRSSPPATSTPAPTQPDVSRDSGGSGGGTYQLLFTRWDGGQHNLYVADTNGDNELFLLRRAAGPSWTHDKGVIFFYGQEGVDRQLVDGVEYTFDSISNGIVSMRASPLPTGMDQVALFQGLAWKQGSARWANVSPNGQMVAFDAKPGGGDYRIFFLGTNDNQQFRFEILGEQADWSPDSEKIVYRSGRGGATGIWISNRDDTGHTLITSNGSDSFPAWSPDGDRIAFSREEGGNVDIYTMNTDGSDVQRLTETPGPDTLPVYTPGGDIIFRSARSGRWDIWKMSGTGANQTEIIPEADVSPDWTFSRMSVR